MKEKIDYEIKLSDFQNLVERSPAFALQYLQNPSMAGIDFVPVITFDYLCELCEEGKINFASGIAELSTLSHLVDSEEKFLKLCQYPEVVKRTLLHENVWKIAAPVIPLMPFIRLSHIYHLDEPLAFKRRKTLAPLDLIHPLEPKCGLLQMPSDPCQMRIEELKLRGRDALILFEDQLFYADYKEKRVTKIELTASNQIVYQELLEKFKDRYQLADPETLLLITSLTGKEHSLELQEEVHYPSQSQPLNPIAESLDLAQRDERKSAKLALRKFPSVNTFFEQMMYGPSGYYSTGRVNFDKDFFTFSSDPREAPGFAAAMAYQLFSLRKKLKFPPEELFNVAEFGPGNGDLCFNILSFSKEMAKINKEWTTFYKSLRYCMIDISPELSKRQLERNQVFKNQVKVITHDARQDLRPLLGNAKMAAVLSNEIMDMLTPFQIVRNAEGQLKVSLLIPHIKISDFEKFIVPLYKDSDSLRKTLSLESDSLKNLYKMLNSEAKVGTRFENKRDTIDEFADALFLSNDNFLQLHGLLNQERERLKARQLKEKEKEVSDSSPFADIFHFIPSEGVNIEFVPQVVKFLEQHPQFCDNMALNSVKLVQLGIHQYLEMANNILRPNGEIITVDYGHHDHLASSLIRAYSNHTEKQDFTQEAGLNDMTCDVNYTVVDEAGRSLDLKTSFFGFQYQLNIPKGTVLSEEHKKTFYIHSEARTGFKAIVQTKPEPEAEAKPVEKTRNQKRKGKQKGQPKPFNSHSDISQRFLGSSLALSHQDIFRSEVKHNYSFSRKIALAMEAKKLCTEGGKIKPSFQLFFKAIKEYQFPEALQVACKAGLLAPALLILKHKDKVNIDINKKTTQGKTALDLALASNAHPLVKSKLVDALKEAGAITAQGTPKDEKATSTGKKLSMA